MSASEPALPRPRARTVHGAAVGILMLDTRFPRLPGDIGNAATWPFPVLYKVVRHVNVNAVHGADQEAALQAFIAAGRELVAAGADGLTTSCGFLTIFQDRLAQACAVPVAASALLQVPWLRRIIPATREIGILTARRAFLTARHLEAAGISPDAAVEGLDSGEEFTRLFVLDGTQAVDTAQVEREMLDATERLLRRHPGIGALVLECANMAPYSARIRDVFGVPVFDIVSLVTWFQLGLQPRRFERPHHVR